MEFTEVVARRRMVRRYLDKPVDPGLLARALTNATRAPSAGFTQGWSFLALRTPADVEAFWNSTSPEVEETRSVVTRPPEVEETRSVVTRPKEVEETRSGVTRPNAWLAGMRTAPVVIVVLASESAYRARYSEADKDGARGRAAGMPWWQIDAAMSALLILQTATDEGLGACFFGIPSAGVAGLRSSFGIPEEFAPIGAITVGYPAPVPASGSTTRRQRRPIAEVAHDGRWGIPLNRPH